MNIPEDLKFTRNDEWVRIEGNHGTVGITDYAQEQLSDIVFVEVIAGAGEAIQQGDSCATVESVKAAADVYAPVSGTVTAVNEALPDKPELVNSDPYGDAWLLKLDLSDTSEVEGLLDAAAYRQHCEARQT